MQQLSFCWCCCCCYL